MPLPAPLALLLAHPVVHQIAPILVVLAIPLLVIIIAARIDRTAPAMVLEALLPWSWSWNSTHPAPSPHDKGKSKSKKKHVRTRTEQLAHNGSAKHAEAKVEQGQDDGYYPGLVNISGTYCFLNATIQAMASLSYLQPHIDAIHTKAEALDVPSPVVDALRDLLRALNTSHRSPTALRPLELISALAHHSNSSLFSSREHQDAQELFQLLSACIKDEGAAADREGLRDPGLATPTSTPAPSSEVAKSVFDGLTANRRSCMECGYTEAVMHFAFDNWQLSVPRLASSCDLEDCLADYTHLEILTDCVCSKCSLLATHRRLTVEAERLSEAIHADPSPSATKKKRAREARKLEARVREALDAGRIEDDIHGVTIDKVFRASTKQAMVARPPPVLALHLNRSMHLGYYAAKNTVRVAFPEVLDLSPYITSGSLSTVPSAPLSSSTSPAPTPSPPPRTLYRLAAAVCHYGQHSFGHYVCFRRKPTGNGWLRISDDSVRECALEAVLAEGAGAFMLFYERMVSARPVPTPRSSEETLKPETVARIRAEAASEEGVGRARVVQSVAAGRGRGVSIAPEGEEGSNGALEGEEGERTPTLERSEPVLDGEVKDEPLAASVPALSHPPRVPSPSPSVIVSPSTRPPRIQAVHSQVGLPAPLVGLTA